MVHEITRRDVLDVLDRVVDGGAPIAANRALAAVRKLFNWCVARDIIAASPCAGVKPPTAERSRDRVLSDDELRLVWRAADKIAWPFGLLVKLLALTGQRRDEVAKMRWDELDLEAGLWTLPRERVKTDQPHEVPLSAACCERTEVGAAHCREPLRLHHERHRTVERLFQGQAQARRTAAFGHARAGGSTICAGLSQAAWRGWASTFL